MRTMPAALASSVDIVSTERAQRMQRKYSTKASGCGAVTRTLGRELRLEGTSVATPGSEIQETEEDEDEEDSMR